MFLNWHQMADGSTSISQGPNSWGIINSMYSINISGCGQESDFSLPLFFFPNMYNIIKFYFLKGLEWN